MRITYKECERIKERIEKELVVDVCDITPTENNIHICYKYPISDEKCYLVIPNEFYEEDDYSKSNFFQYVFNRIREVFIKAFLERDDEE